ncbi:MAG: hypothetical protein ABUL62_03060 [Myxococcales bacterium]
MIPRGPAFLRGALNRHRGLCLSIAASSLLAACGSSDGATGGGPAGATSTAGAATANAGSSNVAGAGNVAGAIGGGGAGGSLAVAGSSPGGAPSGGSGGSNTGFAGANTGIGGASGGGSGVAGASAGGPAGCPTGAAFCDDFDAATSLGSAWSMDNTLNATIKVVNTFTTTPGPTAAHSGTNAVQISFTTGSGYAMIVSKMGFPASPSTTGYWGRVWLYVETPAASDSGHTVYIEGSTGMNLSNNGARPLNTQSGKMSINIDPVGAGEASAATSMAIPRSAWTCFEWQISATGGNGDVTLFVGGAMTAAASIKAKAIQALTEQRIGYERYASGVAGNLWIDDYAIGTARLGCTP